MLPAAPAPLDLDSETVLEVAPATRACPPRLTPDRPSNRPLGPAASAPSPAPLLEGKGARCPFRRLEEPGGVCPSPTPLVRGEADGIVPPPAAGALHPDRAGASACRLSVCDEVACRLLVRSAKVGASAISVTSGPRSRRMYCTCTASPLYRKRGSFQCGSSCRLCCTQPCQKSFCAAAAAAAAKAMSETGKVMMMPH